MEWTGKPWERQKGESEKAHEAFKIYRDLGDRRTVSAVVKKLEKSRNLIDRWKENWEWEERVRAYDNELEKEAKKQAVKERKEMVKRQIDMSLEIQKKVLEAFRAMPIGDMSPKDIREFIKMATELERLNRMMENEQNQNGDKIITELGGAVTQVSIYLPQKEDEESEDGDNGT